VTSEPRPPDPVPEATEKLRSKSVHELPDQKLPDLGMTPHGFMPTVGGMPVDTKAPPVPAPAPTGATSVAQTPVDAINQAVRNRPKGMAIGVHVCRGNYKGMYLSEGGYDSVAEKFWAYVPAMNVSATE